MGAPLQTKSTGNTTLSDEKRIAREFAEFAYIVSHDFNAPLRQIREFSKLLIAKLGDKVGESEHKYVRFIQDNVHNAEAMLEGLLEFSRLNTRAEPFSAVDCNTVLDSVKNSLKHPIAGCNATVISESLPTLNGDENQLKQLWYHLLNNAIKFRREALPPEVHITCKLRENMWNFSIKDNGIGIPEDQQENIFIMFRRLDNDNTSGKGVGLTIARKIVERHGGNMWVESSGDGGSTFSFTLPA